MTRDKKSSKESSRSDKEKKRSSSPKSRGSGGAGRSSSGRVEKSQVTKSASDRKNESQKLRLASKEIKHDPNNTSKERKRSAKTENSSAEKTANLYHQKMTITQESDRKFVETEFDKIKEALVDALEPLEDGCYPQFYSSRDYRGVLVLGCANEQTKRWLEKTVPLLHPWEGAKLRVTPRGVSTQGPKVLLKTPKLFAKTDPKKILVMLSTQNKTLETKYWKNVSVKSEASGQTLIYTVSDKSLEAIRALDNKAYLGLGNVELVILNDDDEKQISEDTQTRNDKEGDKQASVGTDTKNEKSDKKTS